MDYLYLILFFIFGLLLGSFFNVIGLRIPMKKSFIKGRSNCPRCQKQLSWYELIPLISYIIQSGKCRKCNARISFLYPFIELMTAILFSFSFFIFEFDIELITSLLLISMLMIIFISDLTYMVIPNKVLLFFLPLFVLMRIINPLDPWWSSIVGAVSAFLLITLIIFISRGGMGGGDLKLFTLLGIVLGIGKVLLAFLLSCLFGALIGVTLMALGKLKRKEPMPFGPYIVFGTLCAYFFGDFILNWYLQIFL